MEGAVNISGVPAFGLPKISSLVSGIFILTFSASPPITGREALTFGEVTARISTMIGKELTFQPISDEEAYQRYSNISGSAEETEAHVALWRAIREGQMATVTDNVERILGRQPIGLDEWLIEYAGAFR